MNARRPATPFVCSAVLLRNAKPNNILFYFQACIVYRLDSGRIVYQQEIQSKTSDLCSHPPKFLRGIIEQYFGESGTAMCCRTDGCNKDVPEDFAADKDSEHIFLEDFRAERAAGIQQESLRRASGDEDGGQGGNGKEAVASVSALILFGLQMVLMAR